MSAQTAALPNTFFELCHRNGDWREVRGVRAIRPCILEVHWPLGGTWRLDLERNELARAPEWGAADLRRAWAVWLSLLVDRSPTETLETVVRPVKR